ncbi:MAG: glutamine synthetase [Propionibacteriaceae bacterium]
MTGSDRTPTADTLRRAGLRTLTGVIADSGGVLRAKSVPAAHIERFAESGMGASLTWPVFCVDNGVALTDSVGVVGDLRLTADLSAAVVLDHGFAFAPADVRDQEGNRSPYCWRDVARRQERELQDLGLEMRVGHELEFTLVHEDGTGVGAEHGWPCYGLAGYSTHSEFAAELCEELEAAGVLVEQIHAEYGIGQFELSLPPDTPVAAADAVLLTRTVIGRVSRRHGLRISFSPVPFAGGGGNGAHLHFSLTRDGTPLFGGGDGPAGLTDEGAAAVAGVVADLPATMAVLAGTVVSGDRLHPGHWSGAFACWGVENREAAVRVIEPNQGNPRGGNVEVKCIDGGANPYLSTGLVLGLAARGIAAGAEPPPEVTVDPAGLDRAGREHHQVLPLPVEMTEQVELFIANDRVRDILGPALHAAIAAVRRYEATLFTEPDADPHRATRFAWSG